MPPSPALSISERAAKRINAVLADGSEPSATALRVSVLSGGCNGFQYEFKLVDAPDKEDEVLERDGAKVVIDPASLDILAGSELDFADKLMGAHFTIKNPNAQSQCGCGNSFSFDF